MASPQIERNKKPYGIESCINDAGVCPSVNLHYFTGLNNAFFAGKRNILLDTAFFDNFLKELSIRKEDFKMDLHRGALKSYSRTQVCQVTGISEQQFEDYVSLLYGDERFGLMGLSLIGTPLVWYGGYNKDCGTHEGFISCRMQVIGPATEQFWRVQNRADEALAKGITMNIPHPLSGISPTFVDGMVITADEKAILGVRANKNDRPGEILVAPSGGVNYKPNKEPQDILMDAILSELYDETGLEWGMDKQDKGYGFSDGPIIPLGVVRDDAIAFGSGVVFGLSTSLTADELIATHAHAYQLQKRVIADAMKEAVMNEKPITESEARRSSYQVIRSINDTLRSQRQPTLPEDAWEHSELIALPFNKPSVKDFLKHNTYQGHPILKEAKGVVYLSQQFLLE